MLESVEDEVGVILVAARKPTIRRLKTSKMKATYTVPAQVAT